MAPQIVLITVSMSFSQTFPSASFSLTKVPSILDDSRFLLPPGAGLEPRAPVEPVDHVFRRSLHVLSRGSRLYWSTIPVDCTFPVLERERLSRKFRPAMQ